MMEDCNPGKREEMRMAPSVSVVVPCFNSGATVAAAVRSAATQDLSPLEIIVVDDGSDDANTLAVLKDLKGARVIRQENRGLPAARNFGIRHATGQLILPLDADDELEPGYLSAVMDLLSSSSARHVVTEATLTGERSGSAPAFVNPFEQLFSNQCPYCVLFHKTDWEKLGGYDETLVDGYEDWEFNIRLSQLDPCFAVVRKPLLRYRVSGAGMLLSRSRKKHQSLHRGIRARNPELYRVRSLVRRFRQGRSVASRRPLAVYWVWYGVLAISPARFLRFILRTKDTYRPRSA